MLNQLNKQLNIFRNLIQNIFKEKYCINAFMNKNQVYKQILQKLFYTFYKTIDNCNFTEQLETKFNNKNIHY